MLADGVEASVRSLASRDEPAIRAMVARIIEERIADGQFDECDLTLRDLERIREAFVGQLLGHVPPRIAYPQNKVVELESRRAAGGGGGGGEPGLVTRPIYRRPVAGRRRRSATASPAAGPGGARSPGRSRRRSTRPGRRGRPRSGSILADDRELAELNATHMGKAGPTDVLSFPLLPPEAFPPHPGGRATGAPADGASAFPLPPGRAAAPRRHRRLGRAGDRAGRGRPRRPDRRRPLVAGRRAAAARDPRRRSTSAAGTTPSPPRRPRCAPSSAGCSAMTPSSRSTAIVAGCVRRRGIDDADAVVAGRCRRTRWIGAVRADRRTGSSSDRRRARRGRATATAVRRVGHRAAIADARDRRTVARARLAASPVAPIATRRSADCSVARRATVDGVATRADATLVADATWSRSRRTGRRSGSSSTRPRATGRVASRTDRLERRRPTGRRPRSRRPSDRRRLTRGRRRPAATIPREARRRRVGIGPCRAVRGGSVEGRRRSREPGSQYAGTRHNIGWLVMDRLAERAGWTGKGRQRDASQRRHGPLPRPRPDPRQAADVHERLGPRRAQGPGPRARAARSTCWSSPTTSPCRSASSGSARAAARAATTACARSSTSSGPRSSAGSGSGSASRTGSAVDHVLTHVRARRAAAARRAARRGRRRGRGVGARRARARRPTGSTCSSSGRPTPTGSPRPARSTARPDADGIRRTKTGWRRIRRRRRRRMPERARRRRSAAGAAATAGSPSRSRPTSPRATPPPRPTTRSTSTSPRSTPRSRTPRRADARGAPRRPRRARADGAARPSAAPAAGHRLPGPRRRCRRCSPRPARSRRCASGSGRRGRRRPPGRAATSGSSSVPHGAKTYLAAALALVADRRAAGLDRPRRRDRRPRRRGARAPGWATRTRSPSSSRGPRSPTSGASWSPTRPRPGSRRSPRGGAAGPGSSSRASRRSSSTRSPRTTCRPTPRELRLGRPAPPGRAAARAARPRLRAGHRGRRARRVRPARRDRRRLPAVAAAADPDRVLRRRDRLAARLRPDRPADGRHGRARPSCCPRREFLLPAGGAAGDPRAPRPRRRAAPRAPGRATSPGSRAPTTTLPAGRRPPPARPGRWPSATPPRSGPPTSPRRPASTTSTRARSSSSTSPATSPRPPSSCGARPTSGAPSSIAAGELPKDWPSTYLPPRDWKGRLVASRTLELTWESEPPEDARWPAARCRRATCSAGASRSCRRPGRAARRRRRRLARRRRPDRPRLGPGAAPRRAARRGRPSGRGRRAGRRSRRRPARSRSSSGASTAASPAARTASPSSPTASCSGPSASAGRRRSGGSSRATSSSA